MVVITKDFLKSLLEEAKSEADKEIERKRNLILLREDLEKIKRDRERRRNKNGSAIRRTKASRKRTKKVKARDKRR